MRRSVAAQRSNGFVVEDGSGARGGGAGASGASASSESFQPFETGSPTRGAPESQNDSSEVNARESQRPGGSAARAKASSAGRKKLSSTMAWKAARARSANPGVWQVSLECQ